MNGLAKFSTLVLLAAFPLTVACGDDEDDGDDGGGGTGGDGAEPMCAGVYTDRTAAQLKTQTQQGACSDDTDAVCSSDINSTAASCGLACFGQGGDEATQAECTLACLNAQVEPEPSDACFACYIASVGCASTNCGSECGAGTGTDACIQCRADNGCISGFYTCSGLPFPGTDGSGEGGAGND